MAEYRTVAHTSELPPGRSKVVDIDGQRIALFNVKGRYFAIDDDCSHAGGPLAEGDVHGETVECPLHGARFDLATGEVLSPPAETGVVAYPVRVSGDEIMVELA